MLAAAVSAAFDSWQRSAKAQRVLPTRHSCLSRIETQGSFCKGVKFANTTSTTTTTVLLLLLLLLLPLLRYYYPAVDCMLHTAPYRQLVGTKVCSCIQKGKASYLQRLGYIYRNIKAFK